MVWLSSCVLGFALFWPLRLLMLAAMVSWYQHTTQEPITHEIMASLRQKTSMIAAVVAVSVACFYARFVMSYYLI